MPSTYNGIGTHYYGKTNIQKRPGPCPHCHRAVELTSYDTRLWFVVVFIPLIPIRRKRIIDYCPACTRHFAADLEKWETAKQLEISGALEEYRANPTPEGAIAAHQQLLKFHQAAQAAEFQKTMAETYSGNAKVQAYLGAALEHVGNLAQAAAYYARAFALRPDLPEARIGVAKGHIRAGRLDEARPLLDFLEKPGAAQLYSLAPLETLAIAFQQAGRHTEALDLFGKLLAALPNIGEIKAFRDKVKKSECAVGRHETILPKQKFSWRRFFTLRDTAGQRVAGPRLTWGAVAVIGIILALTALGFVIANENIRRHRTIYVANAYDQAATVEIKGVGRLPGVRGVAEWVLPEGNYHAVVAGPVKQELDFEVRAGYFSRWFSDPAWVINVGGDGVLALETAVYSRNSPPVSYAFYFGKGFEFFPRVTHPFKALPETLQIEEGQSRTLTKLALWQQDGQAAFEYVKTHTSPEAALRFAESWLRTHPSDKGVLNRYHFLALAQHQAERMDHFLQTGLTNRPVLVEWHRAYQELHNRPSEHASLMAQYDALLSGDPSNSALLYLRGRVAANRTEARELFQRAAQSDPKNPYPVFALGYDHMMAGDWAASRPLLARAAELDPGDAGFERALLWARFALSDNAAIEQEMQARVRREPVDFRAEMMLINALAGQGRRKEALDSVSAFERDWINRLDASGRTAMNTLRLHALYAVGDFAGLEKAASGDASPAGRQALAQALVEQGRLSEALKLPLPEASEEKLLLLLGFAAACHQADDISGANEWRALAAKSMAAGTRDFARASALLGQTTAPAKEDVDALIMPPRLKAIVLTILAQLHPEAKAEFSTAARLFNIEREFPFHLVERVTAAE
jgi:tetratricopeptide (TPR) repeat protein